MSFDFQTASVLDLVRDGVLWVEDGNHGENRPLSHEFNENGTPFVRPDDLSGGVVRFGGCDRIDDVALQRVRKGKGRAGDIAFTHRATVGRIARVSDDAPHFVANPGVTIWRSLNGAVLDRNYLYYSMQTPFFMDQVWAEAGNTDTFPYISLTQQRRLLVRFPSIEQQRSTGAILGCVDDRITLLRETNATLEAIAQALFKSWFVDFDPVRAKMEGRAPEDMDEATAALFPEGFDTGDWGELPAGWRMSRVSDVVEGVYDGPHATPAEATEGPVFLGIKNLTGTALDLGEIRHIAETDWQQWTRRVEPRAGDMVFSYEATLGFFALIPPGLRCCLGRRLALIRPMPTAGAAHFWFHQFTASPFQRLLEKHTIQGATVNRIALKEFPSYSVLTPPVELQLAFDGLVAPLWAKIHENQAQAQSLTALRDTLLPRLISGQLRVPDFQGLQEAVLS